MADAPTNTPKESMGSKILVGVIVAVGAAIIGYIITYLDQHRKDQVTFVSTQIEKLYGPLFALVQANDIAWAHFHEGYWKDRKDYFDTKTPLKAADIDLWRRWMQNVFQPMNIKMEDALVNNAQLLVGEQMPPMFLQFISHTEAYKSVIAKWRDNPSNSAEDTTAVGNVSPVVFPTQPAFSNCIVSQFHALKALQQKLQEQVIGWFESLKEDIPAECGIC